MNKKIPLRKLFSCQYRYNSVTTMLQRCNEDVTREINQKSLNTHHQIITHNNENPFDHRRPPRYNDSNER